MLLLPMAQGQATTDVLDNLDNIILGLVPPEKGTENEPGQNVEESQFTAAESSTAEVLEWFEKIFYFKHECLCVTFTLDLAEAFGELPECTTEVSYSLLTLFFK